MNYESKTNLKRYESNMRILRKDGGCQEDDCKECFYAMSNHDVRFSGCGFFSLNPENENDPSLGIRQARVKALLKLRYEQLADQFNCH